MVLIKERYEKVVFILAGLILLGSLTACSQNEVYLQKNSNINAENSVISNLFAENKEETPQISPEEQNVINKLNSLTRIFEKPTIKIENENKDNQKYIDYFGGKIKISMTIDKQMKADEIPYALSDGWYITLNGVLQNISVNGKEPCEVYVHHLAKGEDYFDDSVTYSMEIEFEPVRAEADKDKEQLELSIVKISNPDFKVDPAYPLCYDLHSNTIIATRILNVNSDIKTKEIKKSDFSYTEEFLMGGSYGNEGFSANITDESQSNQSIEANENGEIKLGVVVGGKGYEKLRLLFLVNGIPSKLSDGSDYIEIDAKEGYIYTISPDRILNIKLYDTVNVLVTHCPDERENTYLSRAGYPDVVLPYNYYGE